MVDDFESQFIFKLTSIVFDIGSSTELLRYQIQVIQHAEEYFLSCIKGE